VEQFIIGLVSSLGKLDDGPEKYTIVTSHKHPEWLSSYLGPNQRIEAKPAPPSPERRKGKIETIKKMAGPLKKPAQDLFRISKKYLAGTRQEEEQASISVPVSDGFYESLGADVIHFPHQRFIHTGLPAVYNPHDLQHRRLPEFFTEGQKAWRDATYQAGCRIAKAIASESKSTRNDLVKEYGIAPENIHVILWGAPTEFYDPPDDDTFKRVREKYCLPGTFAFYPAQTWPHKNHIGLLKALKILRDEKGMKLNLVCTGRKNDFWPEVEKKVHELGLHDQASFLGFVGEDELRAIYRLSEFVVIPSMFEGGGFPVLEAFYEGTPVSCSNAASLPEYGGEAVIYFNPASEKSMADVIFKMASDPKLRHTMAKRGRERLQKFSWEHTARAYRSLYRMAAGAELTEDDKELLKAGKDNQA